MVDQKTYEIIDQYLNGELIGTTLDKFRARMKTDEGFAQEVKTQEQIIESINIVREKELRAYISKNAKSSGISISKGALRIGLSTAAAIALIVGAFFGISHLVKNNPDILAKEETKTQDISTENETGPSIYKDTVLADSNLEEIVAIVIPEEELESPEILEMDEESMLEEVTEDETSMEDMEDEPEVAKEEELNIQTEVMLSNAFVSVNTISPSFPAKQETSRNVPTTSSAEVKEKKVSESKDGEDNFETEELREFKSDDVDMTESTSGYNYTTRQIEIQYWESPINYKGYNYNGVQVKLYGVAEGKAKDVKELDDRLYIKIDGKQYYIEKNESYNRLVEVTSPTLLKILNE